MNGIAPKPESVAAPSPVQDNTNTLNPPVAAPAAVPEGAGSWNRSSPDYAKEKNFFKRRPTNMPRVLVKPQANFKCKIDNSKLPFKPLLKEKPNALKPLDLKLEKGPDGVERLVSDTKSMIFFSCKLIKTFF